MEAMRVSTRVNLTVMTALEGAAEEERRPIAALVRNILEDWARSPAAPAASGPPAAATGEKPRGHDPELLAKKLEPYLVILRHSSHPGVATMAAKLEAVLVEFGLIPERAEEDEPTEDEQAADPFVAGK
jgi:hypothetical protein